ncbi:MAG: 2-deoxy-D-gluconate 3-dehydrogenase [Rhodospirillales bacterium 69-11]|nr:SDR family oxidoreductase [Rhodospirillales bacterium]MBN8929164.1 SDR family oxidoreductase [Rhodospirillales bacterium]OJW25947.1 MAG: 2-deoxy-D-gluconate 3-dehydrogenase [Rhodospirillales bacterium 69-11]
MTQSASADPAWLGLHGRVAVVTGAGGGIGSAIAHGLARAGASLVLLDARREGAETVAHELTHAGTRAIALQCDIADPDSVAAAERAAREIGPCDVLINNAGVLRAAPLATVSPADWNQLLAVNLTGYLYCAQAFGRAMIERGRGAIVHTASIAGSHAQAFSGAYSVSKAGVLMLSRQLAVEWGPHGVRSNVVSPGLVRTPMSEQFYQAPGVAERRAAAIPLGRIATPEDMAEVALYLSSDRAGFVTGQEVVVDGGFGHMLMSLVPRPGFERGN